MGDWATFAAVGALLIAGATLFTRLIDKSLSIREHDEFKNNISRVVNDWVEQFRRDTDRLDAAIKYLDQAKPTTGELQAAAKAVEDRVVLIENIMKEILRSSVDKKS